MADAYVLSRDDVHLLREVSRWYRATRGRLGPPSPGGQILGPPPFFYGKLDGALAADGSATCSVWQWNGSAWEDSTEDETVYAPPSQAETISGDEWVRASWSHGAYGSARYEVEPVEPSGGRAKWIEFELAADLNFGQYVIADIIDFHDGTDPDPTPNPEAHAAILTTRTDDDTGVVTFAVYGILTTRTDANTGVVTAAGHGLAEGDYADIFWSGGARDHMSVTAVSGNAVSVDGGTGDDLPAEDTAVLITESFVGPPPENGYDHGLVVGDYADVFWVYAAVCYYRKRMKVTAVSGNQVALDQEAGVTYGTALPAADSDVTAIRSFTVWNTRGMYSGLHGTSRSARGTARLSPAKPAYVTPGPPRPDVPEQKEDRYYIDSMECETPNS